MSINTAPPGAPQVMLSRPPGLVGDLADFIMETAAYPDPDIAVYGAEAIIAGIIGRSTATPTGAGVNVHTLFLKVTGGGKDAVKQARNRLFAEVAKTVPAIMETKGPDGIASPQGLQRWLGRYPCCTSIFGEFGPTLAKWVNPRGNANDQGVFRVFLHSYGSSGPGGRMEPEAYANPENNLPGISSPCYSSFAESIPETIYQVIGDTLISSGLLPRMSVIHSEHRRPYLNKSPKLSPDKALVSRIGDLTGYCFSQAQLGNWIVPTWGPGAEDAFDRFERWTTDSINDASSEVTRQLWNRANLKALKRATIQAVASNHLAPVIGNECAAWAINSIVAETNALLGRFTNGDVGEVSGNEARQERDILRTVRDYILAPYEKYTTYDGDPEFHRFGIITLSHILQKCRNLASFKDPREKPGRAIERIIKQLCDGDRLREIPKQAMGERFGKKPRAFAVADQRIICEPLPGDSR